MRERDELQASLLDHYWLALDRDSAALPPAGLDPELAITARQLHGLRPPAPEMQFAARLGERLAAEATALVRRRDGRPKSAAKSGLRWPACRGRWLPLAGLATAAVILLAVVSLALWATRPPTVSAQEVLDKAQIAVGVRSFILTEVTRSRQTKPQADGDTGQEQVRAETTRWYEAPSRWRIESSGTVLGSDGQELPDRAWRRVEVADGTDVWDYDALNNTVQVNRLDPGMNGKAGLLGLGEDAGDLSTFLKRASTCGTPTLRGTETVAGRPAYVIDLGHSTCPSASAPEVNGPSTVWVDQGTFFVLKIEQYSGRDGQLLSTTEVTSVQYDVAIDPARFTFAPPADARVQDFRPKPAPAAEEYQRQLEQLARQVDFPLFEPREVPSGLAPLRPRLDEIAGAQIQLSYVPAAEAGTTALAGPTGVRITEQKASTGLVERWTAGAEPTTIGGGTAWLRRGVRNPDGTGSDSAAIALRDGTLVSVASFTVPADELIRIAGSLEPAPGSQSPLPDPALPTPAEPRPTPAPAPPSFTALRPAWLPEPLTVVERHVASGPASGVVLTFDPRPGDKPHDLLTLTELPSPRDGTATIEDPQATREQIAGREVTIVRRGEGCVTASWTQDGVALTLTNAYDPPGAPGEVRYSCDQVRQIVESVR